MTIRLDGDFGISASGNVTGNYIIGDGSLLTNVGTGSSYGNANVTALLSDGTFAGNIVPAANVTQSLGNATNQWMDLWISNATIYLNSIPLGVGNTGVLQFAGNDIVTSGPNVVNTGNVETSGDVVGGNLVIATGGNLTFADGSVQASAYANANVEAYLPTSNTIITINANVANTDANVANLTATVANTDANVANLVTVTTNTDSNVANLTATVTNTDANVANLVTVTTNTDSNVANLVTVTTNTDSNVANLTATVTNTDSNVANLVTVTTNTDANVANINANVANLTITVSVQGNAIGNLEANAYANANAISLLSSGSITTPIVLSGLNGNVSARNLFVGDSIYAPGQVTQVNFGADYVNYFTFSQYGRVSTNVPFDTTGNIAAGGNISAVGNVTAPFFIGNVFGANVVGEVATANTVSNPLQPNITALGTITSLTANAATINGQFTANGNAQFNQDVYFAGNVTLPGNINQISGNSGSFFGNAVTGFGALYAGLPAGYTLLNQEVMQYATNFNGYTQVTMRNISGGDRATGDFVVTADNGTDTTNYINMGISGSGYNGLLANNSLGTSLYANDGYLYAQGNGSVGGNLVLGSNQTNGVVRIIANGASNIGDVVATFSTNGLSLTGGISSASVSSPAPSISGFSFSGPVVSASGNVTGAYIKGNGSELTSLPAPVVTQDITSVGAMSIMTYDGNVKYVSNATVEPATGNITGGNISAVGNVTGNYIIGDGSQLTNITGNVTFDGVTVQGVNGLNLSAGPDFTANATYLQVRSGDQPSHIHLDTSDNEIYDLFIGDDSKYVQVGNAGNISIASYEIGTATQSIWNFDTSGRFNTPQGGSIGPAGVKGDGTMLTGGAGQLTSVTSYYGDAVDIYSSCVTANPDGTLDVTTYGNGTGVTGQWNFTGANLRLAVNNANGLAGESAQFVGTRKIVNGAVTGATAPYAVELAAGGTPTVAYTSTAGVQSTRITFVTQSTGTGFNWEQFDVIATPSQDTPGEVNYVVSNRVKSLSTIPDTVVTATMNGTNQITISLTLDVLQTNGGYASFDAVEFGLMID